MSDKSRRRNRLGRTPPADRDRGPVVARDADPDPVSVNHAAASLGAERWRGARWTLVALFLIVLATIAFGFHPVGDYFTESDFYGGYADGARSLARSGVDFARYGVVGPVYEFVLAGAGAITGDLFTAARLISVVAAVATLLMWGGIADAWFGPAGAFALSLLLAVNPTFVRYGYSATTDMLAVALATAAIFTLPGRTGKGSPLFAGVWTALAALTRYNLLVLLPALIVAIVAGWTGEAPARRRDLGRFLASSLTILGMWTVASLAAGHLPGEHLLRNPDFFLGSTPAQTLEERYRALAGPPASAPGVEPVPKGPAGSIATRIVSRIRDHAASVGGDLLGWPVTIAALLALAFVCVSRRAAALVAWAPIAGFLLLALAPVFPSSRYALVLLPLALLPLAGGVEIVRAGNRPDLRTAAALVAIAIPAGLSVGACVSLQRSCYAAMPLEARATGEMLRRLGPADGRVLARKGHVAFYAGMSPVPFPIVSSLNSLAAYARERRADYLYYSWFEARLRPEFGYLLDTSATVPGLEVLSATRDKPSVTFRIGPGFGESPSWWNDEGAKQLIAARVNALLFQDERAWPALMTLADNELSRGRLDQALEDLEVASHIKPGQPETDVLTGEVLRRLGRPSEALAAFARARTTRPGEPTAELGEGWALHDLGRNRDAAERWRPHIGDTRQRELLRAMRETFTALGDSAAVVEVDRALAKSR